MCTFLRIFIYIEEKIVKKHGEISIEIILSPYYGMNPSKICEKIRR